MTDVQFIVIDLFCGAGGTTTGFEQAMHENPMLKMAKVIACINHDPIAIKSHWANHADVEHFEEDITTMYGFYDHGILLKSPQFVRLIRLLDIYRACCPNAKVILWASLECTNFSNAKGGKPRDADSRTLAHHLLPYAIAINPDYIQIENVIEFMSWGPLDRNGRPVSRDKGRDWLRWRESVRALGYRDEWRKMNAADYGALTSRNRLFGCFAKSDLPIIWPEPTHTKDPENTCIVKPLRKWEPVKKALDFTDEGHSVFNRKKALSPKTFQRLFMGCIKHIAGGKKEFLSRYYSGSPEHRNHSTDQPAGVVTTNNRLALVKACFISKAYSGKPEDKNVTVEQPSPTLTTIPHEQLVTAFITKGFSANSNKSVNAGASIDKPCPTVATQNRLGLASAHFIQKYNGNREKVGGNNGKSIEDPAPVIAVQSRMALATANFLQKYYGNGENHSSMDEPAGTVTTKDRMAKVQADFFLDKQFTGEHNNQSIEQPAGSILTNDKHHLVKADKFILNGNYDRVSKSIEDPAPTLTADRHHHYLINPSWGGNSGSVDQSCHVVIARQDKAPLYLITCKHGPVAVPVYEDDCEWTIKLKEFMALYDICDIKMRMLKVQELKVIQGFPDDYILLGNQTDQKKFIGNAVHPTVPEHWIKAFSQRLFPDSYTKLKAA